MKKRFTVSGSEELENLISSQMEIISKEVRKIFKQGDLTALVLGGGYGKGEGGVCFSSKGERPFNDYDFFVITENLKKSVRKDYNQKLKILHKKLTQNFGIDVDFAFPVNRNSIKKLPFTQMWGELKPAHIVIYGESNILDLYPHFNLSEMPLSEASKLLLNRGYGLILARNQIESLNLKGVALPDENEVDFIARNIFKAVIGMGDAVMMEKKKFHYSYVEREKIFRGMDDIEEELKDLYSRAIDYKLNPSVNLETAALEECFDSAMNFYPSIYRGIIEKAGSAKTDILKNIIINLREFGVNQSFKWFLRYPRERLVFALPFFLFDDCEQDMNEVGKALNIKNCCNKIDMFKQFGIIWEKFN